MSRKPKASVNPPPILEDEDLDAEMPPLPKRGPPKNEAMLAAIGKKVVETRKAMDWSQTQLARAADVPTSTVFSVENGQHNTSLTTLQKIADALKLEVRDLLPGITLPQATDQGIAMLKLVESALQATLGETNRLAAMLQQVLKMVSDMKHPEDSKPGNGH